MTLIKLPLHWCVFEFDVMTSSFQPDRLGISASTILKSCGGEMVLIRENHKYEFEGCLSPVPYAKFADDADAVIFKLKFL
jgi:hypothetical protein